MSGLLRVLVTGSRDWPDAEAVMDALLDCWHDAVQLGAAGIVVVHGGCPSGADAQADAWARAHGVEVEVWPADWATHGRAAGPMRNRAMVEAGAVVGLAFFARPDSSGTADCCRRAESAGVPVRRFGAVR